MNHWLQQLQHAAAVRSGVGAYGVSTPEAEETAVIGEAPISYEQHQSHTLPEAAPQKSKKGGFFSRKR